MEKSIHEKFMQMAIDLAVDGVRSGKGGPFGAIVVKDGKIVGKGNNQVTSTNDPTAHAEVVAIRDACKKLNTFQLDGCILYTSCEPCPMCLGAIYWARPDQLFYACTKEDASENGFDDSFIYRELDLKWEDRKIPTKQISRHEGLETFLAWRNKPDKKLY
ncbi:nucleoside deaminase [Flexithrix dorotheae]|uniref:nucleoside deaminase n=1 Tax=Flexithrix dorotheae TaxID=70993 RepID=UPI00035E8536|nr:nucleoside deaminase [Flexithrix dorotheae]